MSPVIDGLCDFLGQILIFSEINIRWDDINTNISIRFVPNQITYPGQDSSQSAGFNGISRPLTVKLYDSAANLTTGSYISVSDYSNFISPESIQYTEKVDAMNNTPYDTGNYVNTINQGDTSSVINVSDMSSTFTDSNDNQQTSWNPTGSVANGFAGIAITNNPIDTRGVWQYQDSNGNWNNISTNVSEKHIPKKHLSFHRKAQEMMGK